MTARANNQAKPGPAEFLFDQAEQPVFAVLDGAAAPSLLKHLYAYEPEYCCLYRGELKPDMASVAPYLVRLESATPFAELVLAEGWGSHWGIFLRSSTTLRALRDHFRQFHTVELPDQRAVLFRYYDPRVLRTFLKACNAGELATFFGPIHSFLIEGETAEIGVRFTLAREALKTEALRVKPASG